MPGNLQSAAETVFEHDGVCIAVKSVGGREGFVWFKWVGKEGDANKPIEMLQVAVVNILMIESHFHKSCYTF